MEIKKIYNKVLDGKTITEDQAYRLRKHMYPNHIIEQGKEKFVFDIDEDGNETDELLYTYRMARMVPKGYGIGLCSMPFMVVYKP